MYVIYILLFVVQSLSHIWLFGTPWTAAHQVSLSFVISKSLLKLTSTESVMPSNHLILCHHFSSRPQSFPALGLFRGVGSLHQVAKVLELQFQHQSFHWIFRVDFLWDWLVSSPCSSWDSQESSPVPQFESINSSVFSLLCGPTLTTVCNYWKNPSPNISFSQ